MKTNIAPLINPSNVLDTVAKFFRVMEGAGALWEDFSLPINNRNARRNLVAYLKAGCPKLDGQSLVGASSAESDYDRAAILGKDFISPEEIAQAQGLVYSEAVLQRFAETLPSEEVLQWLRDNDFVLVAGAPEALSLLGIRDLDNQPFCTKLEGWYADEKQRFSREDKVGAEWILLRKGIVPKSTLKNWSEQFDLLSGAERVPNVAEVVWVETTYQKVRGKWLFPDVYARTSSVGADGSHVSVGGSACVGVYVSSCWDGGRHDSLGVSSARK